MKPILASRIDDEGMLIVEVYRIADEELDKLFAEKPEAANIVSAPYYWSKKYGYWPKPSDGWRVSEVEV